MQNIYDFIGYLRNWCTTNNVYFIAGPEAYQNAVMDMNIYDPYDLILCAELTLTPLFNDGGVESVTYSGKLALGRKREESTESNLDETFLQKYDRRLQTLTETLVLFLNNLECNEDATIQSCQILYQLNQYDLNADFVNANISIRFDM